MQPPVAGNVIRMPPRFIAESARRMEARMREGALRAADAPAVDGWYHEAAVREERPSAG